VRRGKPNGWAAKVYNVAAAAGAVVYVLYRWDYSLYFYRYNLVHLTFAVPLALFLAVLMLMRRKRRGYWREWKKNAGVGLALIVLTLFPVVVFLAQWTSSKVQPRTRTSGTVVAKGTFKERGRFRAYRGAVIAVREQNGEVRLFDLSGRPEDYERCRLEQSVTIDHYRWVRDHDLDVSFGD